MSKGKKVYKYITIGLYILLAIISIIAVPVLVIGLAKFLHFIIGCYVTFIFNIASHIWGL